MRKLITIILVLGLTACSYNKYEELYTNDTCDANLPNTYTQTINIILRSNCYSCHNQNLANDDIILESYDQVKSVAASGKLLGVIKHQSGFPPMPYGLPPLRDCEIEKIEQWISAGMPE